MADKEVIKVVKQHIKDNKKELIKNGFPEEAIDWLTNKSVGKEMSYALNHFIGFESNIKTHMVERAFMILGILPYKIDDERNSEQTKRIIDKIDYKTRKTDKWETVDTCFYDDKKIYTFKRGMDTKKKKAYFEITFDYAEGE